MNASLDPAKGKITVANLKDYLKSLLAGIDPSDPSTFQATISEFLSNAHRNYEALDEDAQRYVDGVFDGLAALMRASTNAMPESPEKRMFKRMLATADGEHYLAERLFEGLGTPCKDDHPVFPAARKLCLLLIQNILDVMYDVTRQSHSGVAGFAKVGLVYWAIDELFSALYLAQHAFTNQAYTHVRIVYEILDKIELFHLQPQWAELWASGDERRVLRELRPSEVRNKLGAPKFDPLYSFFSELGPHGTFRGLQARGGMQRAAEEDKSATVRLWVGGCPMVHHVVWTHTACVQGCIATLIKTIIVFEERLNVDEMKKLMEESTERTVDFIKEYYLGWADKEGLDTSKIVEFLATKPWKT